MIFLTVGSHEPFDRLVKAMDLWCQSHPDAQVFGQITSKGTYVPHHFKFVDNLDVTAFEATLQKANILVSHAGMGSIISALSLSKPIVVVPRQGGLQETRNDHQIATAAHLARKKGIIVSQTEQDLAVSIERAQAMLEAPEIERLSPFAQPQLLSFLKNYFETH